MTVRIFTPETAFLQDMADVSRLFYGDAPLFFNEEGKSDVRIAHTVSRQNGCWCDQFTGGPVSVFRAQGRDGEGELMQKRLRKRAVKLALYEYFKRLTGVRPPWGSLTGIRPSRLYYEALEEGLDPVRTLVDIFDVTEERAGLLDEMHDMQKGLAHAAERCVRRLYRHSFLQNPLRLLLVFGGRNCDGRLVAPYVAALKREIDLGAQIVAEKACAPAPCTSAAARPRPFPARRWKN